MPENIVKAWLSGLDIPVSATLLKQQLKSHPDYPSLLSITDTLDYFGITNTAVQVEKEVLPEIDTPFLAHMKNNEEGFVICENGISAGEKYPDFYSQWSGVIVMAEKPDNWRHETNIQYLIKEKGRQLSVLICTAAASAIAVAAAWVVSYWVFTSLLLLAAAGIFVSWMIVSKDLGMENTMADQVCGKEKDCTAVMQSKGAKLPLGITLSDTSLLWFTGLFITLCVSAFTGTAAGLLHLVSILAAASVPFVFYSLYYQWKIVKKWCRLCLVTVALLVAQLALVTPGIIKSGMQLPGSNEVFLFTVIMFLTSLAWFSFKQLFAERKNLQDDVYKGTRFKRNEMVVLSLFEKRRWVDTMPFDNDLQLGNRHAPVQIMVACNPYCGPCAKAHQSLHEILENNDENTGITIRFTVATDQDNKITKAVRHILGHIEQHTEKMSDKQRALYIRQVLHDWFMLMDYEKFSAKYPVHAGIDITGTLRRQEEWCKKAEIKHTPTIFINGYELPLLYAVNDIPGILSAIHGISPPFQHEDGEKLSEIKMVTEPGT